MSVLKRAFSQAFNEKKTHRLSLVPFYQHFDDYFVMVTCLTAACLFALQSRLQVNAKLLLSLGKRICFLFVNLKRAGC